MRYILLLLKIYVDCIGEVWGFSGRSPVRHFIRVREITMWELWMWQGYMNGTVCVTLFVTWELQRVTEGTGCLITEKLDSGLGWGGGC